MSTPNTIPMPTHDGNGVVQELLRDQVPSENDSSVQVVQNANKRIKIGKTNLTAWTSRDLAEEHIYRHKVIARVISTEESPDDDENAEGPTIEDEVDEDDENQGGLLDDDGGAAVSSCPTAVDPASESIKNAMREVIKEACAEGGDIKKTIDDSIKEACAEGGDIKKTIDDSIKEACAEGGDIKKTMDDSINDAILTERVFASNTTNARAQNRANGRLALLPFIETAAQQRWTTPSYQQLRLKAMTTVAQLKRLKADEIQVIHSVYGEPEFAVGTLTAKRDAVVRFFFGE